ncbi:hypothetical protein [Aurantiacibacter suaedae]|uniref:hypothetical protein n=1 Tax=Aurantiacibacter suaedae TaxID=2545755 RepID=UPI0010F76A3A|nr:hypothetical protein [Aurantiacibacter suaedae]
MVLVKPSQGERSLGAIRIALALAIAAFLGASLGMVWHSSGIGSGESEEEETLVADEPAKAPESAQAH